VIYLGVLLAAATRAAALSLVQLAVERTDGDVGLLERSRCPHGAAALPARDALPVARVPAASPPALRLLGGAAGTWLGSSPPAGPGPAPSCWSAAEGLPAVAGRADGSGCWAARCEPPASRPLLAGLFAAFGVALLAFGGAGLLEGRWSAFRANGLLRAGTQSAGAAAAQQCFPRTSL